MILSIPYEKLATVLYKPKSHRGEATRTNCNVTADVTLTPIHCHYSLSYKTRVEIEKRERNEIQDASEINFIVAPRFGAFRFVRVPRFLHVFRNLATSDNRTYLRKGVAVASRLTRVDDSPFQRDF